METISINFLTELLPHLDWLGATLSMPTRPVKLKHRPGITADFSEVPFDTIDLLVKPFAE